MKPEGVRIIYLINGLGSGGAETMLCRLLAGIDRTAFNPAVVCLLKLPGPLQKRIEELGVGVHVIGVRSKHDLAAPVRLYRLLKELNPDILHTQLFAADILGRIMGRILKVPVVITSIRNIYYGGFSRYLLFKWTERFADKTTFVSEAAARRFSELQVLPAAKAEVIHNGLEPGDFKFALDAAEKVNMRKELELPLNSILLLAVGSLSRQKGYGVLFEALSAMGGVNSKFHLIIAGSGPLKEELKKDVQNRGLLDQVLFIGRSDRVPDLMAAADALVLSSLWEGLPGVVMEAMASGLPVVATAVGGTPELVAEGETGFLVPPNEPGALGRALEQVVGLAEGEREKLGQAGRKRVEEYFHVDKMVKGYESLYFEALREKNLL